MTQRQRVTTGIGELDDILGGLYIGDNVVWLDDSGSLASVFCLNFIESSHDLNRPMIYVTFDRSPRNLLEKLGSLARTPNLTILDCFTHGKGASSEIFCKFYEKPNRGHACRVLPVEHPADPEAVSRGLYDLHAGMEGDVCITFESLTGMGELWGGEDALINFYTRTCPRLYELNTAAYWVLEKNAHSQRLRAHIAQIAQVVIDLKIKRGATSLTILKAENRDSANHHQPFVYWAKGLEVTFDARKQSAGHLELGQRLKYLRTKKGISQTELARLVGVTPSTISQVESNHIYPSIPALWKMAEVLAVNIASLFQDGKPLTRRSIFPAADAAPAKLANVSADEARAWRLTPVDLDSRGEPYLIEVDPGAVLPAHFFAHKGQEMGYLISGRLSLRINSMPQHLFAGDLVHLAAETPAQWSNPGPDAARLFWIKFR